MPGSHVFTVASGFGLRVIPAAAPYELATGQPPENLEIDRWVGDRHLFARVTPNAGSYSSELSEATGLLNDVVDIEAGPAFTEWWLETSVYRVPLVHGWRAIVEGAPDQRHRGARRRDVRGDLAVSRCGDRIDRRRARRNRARDRALLTGLVGVICHPERQRGIFCATRVASHQERTLDPSLTLGMTGSR